MSRSFFHHVAAEFAIQHGWDFEQDLSEFHKTSGADLNSPYLKFDLKDGSASAILSEGDVLEASQGNYTDNFKAFWKLIEFKEDAPDDGVVFQSMHSGSSDYLTVSEIKELQKL